MPYRTAEQARQHACIPEFANWDAGWASSLCQAYGIEVETVRSLQGYLPPHILEFFSGDAWDGQSIDLGDGHPFIVINPDRHQRRITFTIVHEVGHILLGHAGMRIHRSTGRRVQGHKVPEHEANRFAREVLLPADEMRFFQELGLRPADIATHKGISKQAIEIRIKTMHQDGEFFIWTEAS